MEKEGAILALLIIVGLFGFILSDAMPHGNDTITGYGIGKKFKKAFRRVEKEVSRSTGKVEAEAKRAEDRVKAEVKRWDVGSPEAKDIKKKSVERTRESIDRMNDKVVAASHDKLCQIYTQAVREGKEENAAYGQTAALLKADLRPSVQSMLVANALTFITLDAQEAVKAANDLQGEVEPLADYQTRKVLDIVIPVCRQMIAAMPQPTQAQQPGQPQQVAQANQPSQEQPAAQPTPTATGESTPPPAEAVA